LVTRDQLLSLGFTPDAIDHRLSRGRLHSAARGVYAVGRPSATRHGRWMAAVLSCGEAAVLSHSSAGALMKIGNERRGLIEISVRCSSRARRDGLVVHRRSSLPPTDVGHFDGIPVTSPVQTLIDLSPRLDTAALERAINEADKYDLVHPPALRKALNDHAGEPGVARLRHVLDRRTFRLTRSELERIFLPMTAEVGLPLPLTKQWVNGFEVDFFWPQLGLVVETDGLRHHRTPAQQAKDRRRDQAHTAAGMIQLRFTHEQIYHEPEYVRGVLAATVPAHKLDRR
jgi:very-short-patch-repair endonuclease